MPSNLDSIEVTGKSLSNEGTRFLVSHLKRNKKLTKLILRCMSKSNLFYLHLGDETELTSRWKVTFTVKAWGLVESLKQNTTLTDLNLKRASDLGGLLFIAA